MLHGSQCLSNRDTRSVRLPTSTAAARTCLRQARACHLCACADATDATQVAINWCICKGTVPIPGAKSLAQAQENLGALGWRLAASEEAALDAAAQSIKKGMVQNIFQTA